MIQTIPHRPQATVTPPRRVLIVDDDEDAAGSLAQWLVLDAPHALEVRVAMDVPQALIEVAAFTPSVVLLDIGLPGLTGYHAAERIRAMPGGDAITLIAITGWGQEDDRRRAAAAGFDHHLTKPIDLDALRRLIEAPGLPT